MYKRRAKLPVLLKVGLSRLSTVFLYGHQPIPGCQLNHSMKRKNLSLLEFLGADGNIWLSVPEEDDNLPLIIGIVLAVVVVVVIGAVVGFVMFRFWKKRSGPGKKKPASESDNDEFTGIDPAVAKIQRKRPIVLEEIEEYVNKMHKDCNLLFCAEYKDLKTLSPMHACEAGERMENIMRNRYINIIPFDHTRVKLSTNGEDDSSDYINANYLPGYSSPREYIGCQGPIPGTIDDFWRMTWEQNVSVVVLLTLCKEEQKFKCEKYWPDEVGEPEQYGDVIVETTSYSDIRTYDFRKFKITNGSTTRVVKHFHFLSWLDYKNDVYLDIILDFIQYVRQVQPPPDTSGPMIIQCSEGVGRTGTYIAVDYLMQFINEHDVDVDIDIFDLVLKLRENRRHIVRSEVQYALIHDCVKEIMDRKRRQMENIYENQAFYTYQMNVCKLKHIKSTRCLVLFCNLRCLPNEYTYQMNACEVKLTASRDA
ncbi:receptor-type tyrosine-protein phosphatase eta-like [Mercenaria mercenaria]|uniref:receptor-type tyrosine-protein phosphatase eta-like n=1 Tax=Mercenaria mercenaria TaxID=6596 RepID=UPI00234E6F79|nr:receptor-type tyrosine-protein phosphatase eta-like [Mercenaria mercenaria]